MKVMIDDKPDEFISILRVGHHWQCNTTGNKSAHNFGMHPKFFEKGREIKTNGHVYIFLAEPDLFNPPIELNIEAGRKERDKGIKRAMSHADKVRKQWNDDAYAILIEFAATKDEFLAEEVRLYAQTQKNFPPAPDERAWGGIVNRASFAGKIKRLRYEPCKNKSGHASPKTVWSAKK